MLIDYNLAYRIGNNGTGTWILHRCNRSLDIGAKFAVLEREIAIIGESSILHNESLCIA